MNIVKAGFHGNQGKNCTLPNNFHYKVSTSRDRPKSAPYLRLKNSKRTSTCQSILFYSTKKISKPKNWRVPFRIFQHPFCRKTPKNWRGPCGENFFLRVSQCRKNWKGTLWSRPVLYVTRESFLVVPWANRCNMKFCRTFGRTILVTSGVSKKNLKKHFLFDSNKTVKMWNGGHIRPICKISV